MKKSLYVSAIVLFATVMAFAQSPFPPWLKRVTANDMAPMSAGEGIQTKRVATFIYDTATDGATATGHGLGVYLPANSVITRSSVKIITQFADSGFSTVALSCEDANNIRSAEDLTAHSANTFIEGRSSGTAAGFIRDIGALCEITATIGGSTTPTAGKLIGWVEYYTEP